MWEPQPLTTLRASKACRGENFTLPPLYEYLLQLVFAFQVFQPEKCMHTYLILFILINLKILGKEWTYKLQSSLLCAFSILLLLPFLVSFPTAAARVHSRVWSSGICGGQSGAGADFLRVLRLPLSFTPSNSPSSQSPGAGTIGQ
jgi:hypothetical protein